MVSEVVKSSETLVETATAPEAMVEAKMGDEAQVKSVVSLETVVGRESEVEASLYPQKL